MASRSFRRGHCGAWIPRAAVCAGLALQVAAAAGGVGPIDAGMALGKLQRWLDETRNLQGRFAQQLESGALGAGLEERGRFFVERPGRMRWDYLDPELKTAIVSDNRTWLYVEEERQLILGRLDEQEDLLTGLLAGAARLDELFEASPLPDAGSADGRLYRLRLEPKSDSEALEWLILDLAPPEFSIVAAEVMDSAGNRMRYRFQRLRRNRGLPEDIFRFDAPPGTHVAGAH